MRPTLDTYFLAMLPLVASRSTCARRAVGAILVSAQGVVLSTGYNGVPRRHQHCTDVPCAGADAASGTRLTECLALHAEENALLFAGSRLPDIHTLYVSVTPCARCARMLTNTALRRLVALEKYPDEVALDTLLLSSIQVTVIK